MLGSRVGLNFEEFKTVQFMFFLSDLEGKKKKKMKLKVGRSNKGRVFFIYNLVGCFFDLGLAFIDILLTLEKGFS